MADLKTNNPNGLITTIIKAREEIYYLVTNENLAEIKKKKVLESIFIFIDSIIWGAFFSTFITLKSSVELTIESTSILKIMWWIFLCLGVVFLGLVIYFMFDSYKSISRVKSSGKVPLETQFDELNRFKIIKALYGANNTFVDVEPELTKLIKNNKLHYRGIYNDLKGDPLKNTPKTLTIKYMYMNQEKEKVYSQENSTINLPE